MHRIFASLALICAVFLAVLPTASAITMAWSPVGNPGNAPDTVLNSDGTTGYGSVAYNYSIGTYDVTNSQYVAFLNSNDATGADPLGIYNSKMSNGTFGGINFNSGAANGSKYSVISGNGNNPVSYVTFYDTLRFANWLNNGQVAGSTETGSYTLLGGTPTPSNGDSITRNAGATVVLPSENEWYKAAYYNPTTSSYFQYPTSSNIPPMGSDPTSAPNSANIVPEGIVPPGPDNLTAVGAYTGTTSPYGAYDMGGNVYQWNEALIGSSRGVRGGSFVGIFSSLLSSNRLGVAVPASEFVDVGFRVAMVPEPSTLVLAALACGVIWWSKKRFK